MPASVFVWVVASLSIRFWPNNGQMIRFTLGGTPTQVRFGISPIHETLSVVRALAEPHRHPLHTEWLRRRARAVSPAALDTLRPLIPASSYRPDFLDPPPAGQHDTIEDGLSSLARTPREQVSAELRDSLGATRPELLRAPVRLQRECAAAIRQVWQGCTGPGMASAEDRPRD